MIEQSYRGPKKFARLLEICVNLRGWLNVFEQLRKYKGNLSKFW
jgi:hypothetical protein